MCSKETYRVVYSGQGSANTILCTGEIFTDHARCRLQCTLLYIWGSGFLTLCLASLLMYCIDARLRILTKSLFRTAPPFSILNGFKSYL
jgi:hypothetical protein